MTSRDSVVNLEASALSIKSNNSHSVVLALLVSSVILNFLAFIL